MKWVIMMLEHINLLINAEKLPDFFLLINLIFHPRGRLLYGYSVKVKKKMKIFCQV